MEGDKPEGTAHLTQRAVLMLGLGLAEAGALALAVAVVAEVARAAGYGEGPGDERGAGCLAATSAASRGKTDAPRGEVAMSIPVADTGVPDDLRPRSWKG